MIYSQIFPVNYLLFTQIILFLFITPGSPRILVVSYAMTYGMKKTTWTALGDISANTVQMIIVIFGVSSILIAHPSIMLVVKWLGVTYLVYLALEIFYSKVKNINLKKFEDNKKTFSFFKDGFIVAGLSPKAIIFFGTIFPNFIDFSANYIIQFFILAFTYISLDFISLLIYGFTAKRISVWLKANPKTINFVSSLALIIIAFIAAFVKI